MSEKYIHATGTFDGGEALKNVIIMAFFSDLFSARQIDPDGVWKIHIWRKGENQASVSLMLTKDERDALIEQLSSTETTTDRIHKALTGIGKVGEGQNNEGAA